VRVLVTGSTGLLGATLLDVLKARGFEVLSHARSLGDLNGDLRDPEAARALLTTARPDTVVNLAALTNVDRCESHPQEAYIANTRIVENLANSLECMGGGGHLVQISTDQLYDGAGPHAEDEVTLTNYYAFSKYAGELAAAAVNSTILRTNFFGRSRHGVRRSFSDWLVDSLRQDRPVQVFTDVAFSPLSLERLTDLVCKVIERPTRGVFNLGSRDGLSKADFCFSLARALELPTSRMTRASSADAPLKAYRPKDMRMNCARFEAAFMVRLPSLAEEIESMKRCYSC
jgi:dTDP-4-dehydrorhamnose reductase